MKLIRAVLFDALVAACIYGWRVEGMHSAEVFLKFWMWFVVGCQAIFVLCAAKEHLYARSRVEILYDIVSTVAITAALLWSGLTTIAICMFIGWIFVCAKLKGYKKELA
jgi:hypothetical protein